MGQTGDLIAGQGGQFGVTFVFRQRVSLGQGCVQTLVPLVQLDYVLEGGALLGQGLHALEVGGDIRPAHLAGQFFVSVLGVL